MVILGSPTAEQRSAEDILSEAPGQRLFKTAEEVTSIPETRQLWEDAAGLRATTGLKTPDALHAAAAILAQFTLFITNNYDFCRLEGLPVVLHKPQLDATDLPHRGPLMTTHMRALFRIPGPSQADIEAFHNDGYIAYPDVFTDGAREALIDEIEELDHVRAYIQQLKTGAAEQKPYFIRPWNDRGPYADRLIDDPFITALLQATIGDDYHFCHSALNIAPRGAPPLRYHQDHHHWRHENPVNLAERDKYYIQVLYYLNGFSLGDRNLKVIAGSHKVAPTQDATPERMLAGELDAEAGRPLEEKRLELPPGSMVYINARIFHAVEPKPADSKQPYRFFNIDIFKEAGPPHRYTQEIPPEWIARAGPQRKKLFKREAYSEGCWDPR